MKDRRISRRGFLGATGLLLAGGALSACGGGQPTTSGALLGGPRPLTIWASQYEVPGLEKVAARFQEDTGVSIRVIQRNYNGQMLSDFLTQVPTGEGPDIIVAPHDVLGQVVNNGAVSPVDLIDPEETFLDIALQAITYDGRYYGVPFIIENVALLRNNALTEHTPDTFDDLLAEGHRLIDAGAAKYAFTTSQSEASGDPYHLYPLQSSFGAEVFRRDADGAYTTELGMGGEEGRAFAAYLAELGRNRDLIVTMTPDISKQAFIDGETPYFIAGPWNLPDIQAAGMDIAVLSVPSAGGRPAIPFVGVSSFMINANSASPLAARDLALNYLSRPEVQLELFTNNQRPPANREALAGMDDPVLAEYARIAQEDGAPMPSIPQMGAVWNFWGTTENGIVTGAGDPAQLWDNMITNIERAIES
ncbi:sugar ABC transporter substrate-binding protein [Corynebacterium nasicanis]|uniref:Extracellular solute-binding protein n=1 Tax=Corynebacterium nasicanis TaxID=1448267 RepID=A0ABW1QG39_9CORY